MKKTKYIFLTIAFILAVFSLLAISDAKAYACSTGCTYPPVTGSCSVSESTAHIGDTVTFTGSASGGNGYYTYSWNGTDGLSGLTRQVSQSYSTSGTKYATVTITSNNQSIQQTCSVNVNQPQQNNLVVSCSANPSSVNVNNPITWTANVSGGNGNYSYSWNGTDGLSGSSQSVSQTYANSGSKTATVTVNSNGQTQSATCNAQVNQTQNNLVVSCSANPNSINVGGQIGWTANVSGGNGNYSYYWSGSNSLSGSSQTVYQTYNSAGNQTATVTVNSNGQSQSASCNAYVNNNYQNNLTASCQVSPEYANVNNQVIWSVNASGGNGNYSYSWNGTDGLSGSSQTVYQTYNNPGTKYGTVTIYSNGQSITQTCTTNIQGNNYINNNISAYCEGTPSNPGINNNVTWTVYPSGGIYNNNSYNYNNSYGYNGYYTYSWNGTDGLYSSNSTAYKSYQTSGYKYATVTVYENGQQVTASCNVNVGQNNNAYLYTQPTPPTNGGVYLNSIPATGISPTVKTELFVGGLFIWSAFLAYLYVARRNEKRKEKEILESIGE